MLPRFKAELIHGRGARGPFRLPSMLLEFNRRISDWKEFWSTVFVPRYLNLVQQNFQTEGEFSRRAGWPDLDPRYAAWKARHFPGTRILERTRRLRDSLSLAGVGGGDMVLEAGPRSLRLGTRVPHAKFHVYERPFLVPVTQREWQPVVERYVREQEAKAGLRGR